MSLSYPDNYLSYCRFQDIQYMHKYIYLYEALHKHRRIDSLIYTITACKQLCRVQ